MIDVSQPLTLPFTIVFQDAGGDDGWVMATIPEYPGAISQGATRDQARETVLQALRELVHYRA